VFFPARSNPWPFSLVQYVGFNPPPYAICPVALTPLFPTNLPFTSSSSRAKGRMATPRLPPRPPFFSGSAFLLFSFAPFRGHPPLPYPAPFPVPYAVNRHQFFATPLPPASVPLFTFPHASGHCSQPPAFETTTGLLQVTSLHTFPSLTKPFWTPPTPQPFLHSRSLVSKPPPPKTNHLRERNPPLLTRTLLMCADILSHQDFPSPNHLRPCPSIISTVI